MGLVQNPELLRIKNPELMRNHPKFFWMLNHLT